MSHPTDDPTGGVETPIVPTPRPKDFDKNETPDPARYSPAGDEEAATIQEVIRSKTQED